MLVDTERRVKDGVVRSSGESDPGWVTGGVDSGCLNGTLLEDDDANLERNFLVGILGAGAWDLLASCSTSCRIFFIATRSKPACLGISGEGGLSLGGVDGLDKVEASPPEFVIGFACKFGAGEGVGILGGRSPSASTSQALLAGSLLSVFREVDDFWGVALVFFRENHPDFFFLSSSRTTTRSSRNSGSYKVDKHAE
jgi:hypothetical protein